MANLIQIKRSTTTATPPTLARGELAYTSNGEILYIGSPNGNNVNIPIAGPRYPGTLTANQALVANSTGYIDAVKTANLTVQSITANGVYSPGAGYLLSVDAGGNTFWLDQGAVSINTAAQYTWTNTHSFTAALTTNTVNVTSTTASSNTTTGALKVAGGLGVAGRINTGDLAAGNDSVYSSLTGTTLTTVNVNATDTVNAATLSVGGWVIANQSGIFTSGIVNADILAVGTNFRANTTQVTIGSGIGLSANGSTGSSGQVLHSNGSSVYWATTTADITDVVAGNGLTGGGSSGSVTLDIGTGNGIAVDADSIRVQQANGIAVDSGGVRVDGGSTLTVNNSGAHVNTNLAITSLTTTGDVTVNGNTQLGNAATDVVSFVGVVNSAIIPSANLTHSLGNTSNWWSNLHANGIYADSGLFYGNLTVNGNIVVTGNLITQNVSSVIVSDPLLYLAGNNYESDLVDIGFVANYSPDGIEQLHTGFFRDASDGGKWKLFVGSEQELSGENLVNTTANGYLTGTLQTLLDSGGLQTNSTSVTITANSSVKVELVANTLSLSSPLLANSGGTGLSSYTIGDIIVANSSSSFAKLSLGTTGYVLQSNGSALVYDTLDGGEF